MRCGSARSRVLVIPVEKSQFSSDRVYSRQFRSTPLESIPVASGHVISNPIISPRFRSLRLGSGPLLHL